MINFILYLPENPYSMAITEDSLYHAADVYHLRFDWVVVLSGRKKEGAVPKNL